MEDMRYACHGIEFQNNEVMLLKLINTPMIFAHTHHTHRNDQGTLAFTNSGSVYNSELREKVVKQGTSSSVMFSQHI